MQFIITRPSQQNQLLNQAIVQLGYNTQLYPCVIIKPDINNTYFQKAIAQINNYSIVIFTSANAAAITLEHIAQHNRSSFICLGIGPATTKVIEQYGFNVEPAQLPASSQTLLKHPLLLKQHIENTKVVIFCGYNPRATLKKTLTSRGAIVDEAFCYHRLCPPMLTEAKVSAMLSASPVCFICTSLTLLKNLIETFPAHFWSTLKQQSVLVINQEMQQYALEFGFLQIIQAYDATQPSIIEAICQHFK